MAAMNTVIIARQRHIDISQNAVPPVAVVGLDPDLADSVLLGRVTVRRAKKLQKERGN